MIYIYTGDEQKCRQINYWECPACGSLFEFVDGHYEFSNTLDDYVYVCPRHEQFSCDEEIFIQNSLEKAKNHNRGRISKNGKDIKISKLEEMEKCQNSK
jgi:hypothetical protein